MCDENSEEDLRNCCNSGCNICILDSCQSLKRINALDDRPNLLSNEYKQFKVVEIIRCSTNVNRFKFQFFDSNNCNFSSAFTLRIPPTFHLMLRASVSECDTKRLELRHDKETIGNYISRPYTPISVDSDNFNFDILVKFEPNGIMSQYIQSLTVGSLTEWKGVYGELDWIPGPSKKYLVCICQGVAVASIFSLISSILANELDETMIHLFACFKNIDNILLRSEMCSLQLFWNFKARIYLSKQQHCDLCLGKKVRNCDCIKSDLKFNESIYNYRLDEEELTEFYRQLKSNSIFTIVCANDALESVVRKSLEKLEIDLKSSYFRLE